MTEGGHDQGAPRATRGRDWSRRYVNVEFPVGNIAPPSTLYSRREGLSSWRHSTIRSNEGEPPALRPLVLQGFQGAIAIPLRRFHIRVQLKCPFKSA